LACIEVGLACIEVGLACIEVGLALRANLACLLPS
jgi:hypothetical protein